MDVQQNSKHFKILLINPPHIQEQGLYPRVVFEPIGLAYVAGYLEREGYDVEIVDAVAQGFDKITCTGDGKELVGLTYEDIGNSVAQNPDVVGIAVPFTVRAESAFAIASLVKKINSNIPVILGGIYPTSNPFECLQQKNVDYIVRGEGEITTLKLVEALRAGSLRQIERIQGIGYKKDGKITVNPCEVPIENLDSLPFPARHLLPMERYFEASKVFLTGRHGKRFASVCTSRGCPFKCTFCVSHKVMGRKWRYRSPENVVDEVEMLMDKYGVNFIHFEDDNMTLNPGRMARICELLMKRKLKVDWDTPNGVRADTIANEEILRKMKQSGCRHICIAPESGNQYVVNNIIKKNLDLGKVEQVVRLCRKIELKVDAFFVIGLVGETKEQIKDTIRFAGKLRKLGLSRCHFHIATPFEGTEIYEQAKEKGYLREPDKNCIRLDVPRIETPEFTAGDVDRYFIEGCRLNPVIPFDKIGLAFHLLLKDPVKLFKSSFNYLVKRVGGLSS